MNTYNWSIVGLVVLLLTISIGMLGYMKFVPLESQVLKMEYAIGDTIGMNVGSDALYFGMSPPGGQAKRKVNLTNYYDFPIAVTIKINGDISQYISVSTNEFVLGPGEKTHIIYYANSDKNDAYGNYTGYTQIVFKRAVFS